MRAGQRRYLAFRPRLHTQRLEPALIRARSGRADILQTPCEVLVLFYTTGFSYSLNELMYSTFVDTSVLTIEA